ncbi:MAG: acyl-CoA dehydrogenase family protein [candidate division WOR-3 bacterium]
MVTSHLPDGSGYITLAKTNPEVKKTCGMSLFYIPIKETKGITTTILKEWGRKGISSGGFTMDNVELAEENLIGDEKQKILYFNGRF